MDGRLAGYEITLHQLFELVQIDMAHLFISDSAHRYGFRKSEPFNRAALFDMFRP